jgi:hypothetical protein
MSASVIRVATALRASNPTPRSYTQRLSSMAVSPSMRFIATALLAGMAHYVNSISKNATQDLVKMMLRARMP